MFRIPSLVLADSAAARRARFLRRLPSMSVGIGLAVASAVPFAVALGR